jgi:hypothetical protein
LSQKPWMLCFLQNSQYKEELSGLRVRLDVAVQQFHVSQAIKHRIRPSRGPFQNANLITLQASVKDLAAKLGKLFTG